MSRKILLILTLSAVMVLSSSLVFSSQKEETPSLYRLADLKDIIKYPEIIPKEEKPAGKQIFLLVLPDTKLAVILRPISEAEYGSFQVQAIGYQIIECQMLAAAIVLPSIKEGDIAGLAPDLVIFLKRQVNIISGFDVFDIGDLNSLP